MDGAVLGRRHAAEGVVGSCLVVVDHPPLRGLADVLEAGEQILFQLFPAEGAVASEYIEDEIARKRVVRAH